MFFLAEFLKLVVGSGGGVVVKLLACSAKGPGSNPDFAS